MSIITISRGSYGYGHEVAEEVARRLDYTHVSREILLEASNQFNVPEVKLQKAFDKGPSILDQITNGREKYIAYIEAAFLERMTNDNVVYEGFAGHFFIRGIAQALKVRINADIKKRVKLVMDSEGLSEEKALKFIKKIDQERKKWGLSLYRLDTFDTSLYDLVVQIGQIGVEDAIELICNTVNMDQFKTTPESKGLLYDRFVAARVRAKLISGNFPKAVVDCRNGVIEASALAPRLSQQKSLIAEIERIAGDLKGVSDVKFRGMSEFHKGA